MKEQVNDALNNEAALSDPTENARRKRLAQINSEPGSRSALESVHGQVWDTSELQRDFVVVGFLAPYVIVERKDNREEGTLEFQHHPRFYYDFRSSKR